MREDIEEVLVAADEVIARLKNQEALVKNDQATGLRKTDVKSALEHLRSVLDYVAVGVDNVLYGGANGLRLNKQRQHVYFPYGTQAFVDSKLKKLYGDLDVVAPKIYALVHSIQEHATGSDWLEVMCGQVNKHKHAGLSKHAATGGREAMTLGHNSIRIDRTSQVTIRGGSYGGVQMPSDRAVTIRGDMSVEQARAKIPWLPVRKGMTDQSISIAGTNWEVVSLLSTARAGIGRVALEVMSELSV